MHSGRQHAVIIGSDCSYSEYEPLATCDELLSAEECCAWRLGRAEITYFEDSTVLAIDTGQNNNLFLEPYRPLADCPLVTQPRNCAVTGLRQAIV
jgi:hypothetical protein